MNQINEIRPEQSVELLKELHILTRDGKLNQDSRRKLKQIYHLYNFLEPLLNNITKNYEKFNIIDHGAGKSYLGFIIYDLFLKKNQKGEIFGIESRDELVKKSIDLAKKFNFERMNFHNSTIKDTIYLDNIPKKVEMVTALHACDTATDDAIKFGIKKNADYIVLIPCCQAEVASILRKNKGKNLQKSVLTEVFRHPIHTREFGSHITNVLRCLELEANGYQVTVTELIGWEHSMKNELIIGHFKDLPRSYSKERLRQLISVFNLEEIEQRFIQED
jgi:hypothetical protein